MKTCPACHKKNPEDAAVCIDCNYSLTLGPAGLTAFASNSPSHFESGYIFADRYRIEKTLGRGGMGIVYLAADLELREKQVALKLIHPDILSKPGALRRFQDEVLTCQELRHRSIVQVYDLKRHGEQRFYTMEYIAGRSLREWIIERKNQKNPFTIEEAASVILPLLEALAYAHRKKTIHRDVKPENIILIGEFPDIKIKVVDFGIAKTLSASHMSEAAQSLGTAYYMAPEQLEGKPVDHRADLYSVGMVLYELLTGEMALGMAEPPSALNPDLPPEIDGLVGSLLKRLPEQRYADAIEASQTIARITADDTPSSDKRQNADDGRIELIQPLGKIEIPVPKKSQDVGVTKATRPPKKRISNSLGMEFVWIEPGTFMMGSPEDEEGRNDDEILHKVTLTKGFYLQTTPVTVGQWRQFFKAAGYRSEAETTGGAYVLVGNYSQKKWEKRKTANWDLPHFRQDDNHPVTCVSWNDTQMFIKWMNQHGEGTYALPTEAQWEYACRADTSTPRFWGAHSDTACNYANLSDSKNKKKRSIFAFFSTDCNESFEFTAPVDSLRPNPLGLYNMLGNLWEWCSDWYGDYPLGPVTDYKGPAIGSLKVTRGGSWNSRKDVVRSALRYRFEPNCCYSYIGFRLSRN